jgi:hypothetical protein
MGSVHSLMLLFQRSERGEKEKFGDLHRVSSEGIWSVGPHIASLTPKFVAFPSSKSLLIAVAIWVQSLSDICSSGSASTLG